MENTENKVDNKTENRTKYSLWMQAIRPFSFSASATPIIITAMIALYYYKDSEPIMWSLFPIILISGMLFHTSANLIAEYYDYINKVDRKETFGSSRILVDNLLPPKHILYGGLIALIIGFLLGLILVYFRGASILYLGLIGMFFVWSYTAMPLRLKYIALGDLVIFLCFGPLLFIGAYLGLTGTYLNNIFWMSLPMGFLVVAILNANNTRDIFYDRKANIKTISTVMGVKASRNEYFILIIGAYVSIIIMIILEILSPWTLLVFISLPPALSNLKKMSTAKIDKLENLVMLDVTTAQHHMLFGLLQAIGILVGYLVR